MAILTALRNLFFGPRIANCCACNSKNVTVELFDDKNGLHYASVSCDDCERRRTLYSEKSEKDAMYAVLSRWNEEYDYYH